MASDKALISMLEKRKLELLKELHAIDIILNANAPQDNGESQTENTTRQSSNVTTTVYENSALGYHSTRDQHIAMLKQKTESVTWKDYILKAVELLSPVSAKGIADLINDANDHKISAESVKQATSASLRELVDEKKLAKQHANSKEGHLYYLPSQKPGNSIQ